MNTIVRKSALIGEEYHETVLDNGLKILVCPKKDYASSYALFGTRYGSIDTRFKLGGEAEFTEVPEGIAHFLEHKLFESEEGDVFARYAETGASANAYTSFDRTCYLFSCSSDFERSFDILLDFVQSPYFTRETVEKEQGIIGQEIRMYDDTASWRVFFNLLTALYHKHPVRVDIAGTAESIAKIDADLLYRCYNTFYNPANMFVCAAGNVDPQKILEMVEAKIKPHDPIEIIRASHDEPREVRTPKTEQKLAVAMPLFALGYKEDCAAPQKTVRERAASELLLDAAAGSASPLYKSLFDDGLINNTFETEYFYGHYHAAAILSGESKDPDAVRARIGAEFERLRREGLSDEAFENSRRKLYGHAVMRMGNVEAAANALVQCAFAGEGLFDEAESYHTLTKAEVLSRLEALSGERSALSVINPA